jgi:hypothetical protein
MANFEGAAKNTLYSVKYMLTDGNWGAHTILNAGAVKPLPGTGLAGAEAEDVAYGGNWGDYVTGFSFGGELGDYAGNNYWDNFAEYIYGGYITGANGHTEPLVFLQNLFSHRAHEDFDVALSPSRFARLNALGIPGSYDVTVFAYGFPDITFEFDVRNYINPNLAISEGTSFTVDNPNTPISFTVTGAANAVAYAAGVKLFKGKAEIGRTNFVASANSGTVDVTLQPSIFVGSYQGAYTLKYKTDVDESKPLGFTLVNPVAVKLKINSNGVETREGYTSASALSISKSDDLYFLNDDFASTLVVAGRAGFSTYKVLDADGAGTAIGATAVRSVSDDDTSPYCIDIANAAFVAGNTYALTMIAPGFQNQIYYITITN